MSTGTSLITFDQGNTPYVPSILALASSESSRGEDLDIDVLALTEQTSGASELANVGTQKLLGLLQSFSAVEYVQRLTTSLLASFITSSARTERIPGEKVDSPFRQFENQVRAMLEADSIEDGYSHPAEAFMERIIQDSRHCASDWLIDILSSNHWKASLKAELFRLLSRQKPFTEDWRLRVVQLGLSSSNVELRDASVQAAESWEEAGIIPLLQAHKEPCSWLADYISRVIQDLMR